MSQWLKAAKQFEEVLNSNNYFEVQASLGAIEKINATLNGSLRQLIFLLGEPGSGKSFLLYHLKEIWKNDRDILLIETPFLTPVSLLKKLIEHKGVAFDGGDIEQYRTQATQLYGASKHLIMIDEAQLLSTEMREFIRILSDTKSFWFMLAMHRSEGEALLRVPHFKSRPHKVIALFELNPIECKNYLYRELFRVQFSEISDEITAKLIAQAYKISQGNFRNFKKIFFHLFHLLHYTNTHNQTKYLRPSQCMITMAAMSAELLND